LSTMLIPFPVIMIPQYVLFKNLGWIDTFLPLIVPPWFGSAFLIFMMRQFYLTIPRELDDAAEIDGCSYFGIYWRIMLPLSKPALPASVQCGPGRNRCRGRRLRFRRGCKRPVDMAGAQRPAGEHLGAESSHPPVPEGAARGQDHPRLCARPHHLRR